MLQEIRLETSKFAGSRKKLKTGINASTPIMAAAARLRSTEMRSKIGTRLARYIQPEKAIESPMPATKPMRTAELRNMWNCWGTLVCGRANMDHGSDYDRTRNYCNGCAIATKAGGLGALSLPARSTAVTTYQ